MTPLKCIMHKETQTNKLLIHNSRSFPTGFNMNNQSLSPYAMFSQLKFPAQVLDHREVGELHQ